MPGGWLHRLFGGKGWLKARDIIGCVFVGGNSGIVYQIYNGGEPPEPPSLPWEQDLPSQGSFEIFNLLRWTSRLSPELIGRDRDKQDLLSWATSGRGLRIRLLSGPGGAGKTRLAAELAQSLRDEGWHAGFTPIENGFTRPISSKGLLLILDYPEEWRAQVRALFQTAPRIENLRAPIRLLLLSRQTIDHWRDDIEQAGASALCDSYEVTIGPLDTQSAIHLFRVVVARLADNQRPTPSTFDDTVIAGWIERDPARHALPLYTIAAAVREGIEPGETLGLSGSQIITELVDLERRRLDAGGRNAGWGEQAASRLAGLAALGGGLDAAALHRLALPQLEIGLPPPERIVDAVKLFGWWENERFPPPSPDLVAAALLRRVLLDRPDRAPEWVWEALSDCAALDVQRLDRLVYDTVTLQGPNEAVLVRTLVRAVGQDVARAARWHPFFDTHELGFRLSPVGIAVAEALLATPDLPAEDRARILANSSNQLNDAGDTARALAAIREAVEIYRRLTEEKPGRFTLELATSSTILSEALRKAGDRAGALEAIRVAVEVFRGLAQENPARFDPVLTGGLDFERRLTGGLDFERRLAGSLNNLSAILRDDGEVAAALTAIREAVDIFQRLAQVNPSAYASDFASGLNTLSNSLSDAGEKAEALAAIREAVEIRRRQAKENPARFEPDLAAVLNNLSNRLSDAGDKAEALTAIREAVEIRRRLAKENPARFGPDLARSLNNRADRLSDAEDKAEALTAIREAVEVYRELSQANPARFAPALAQSLDNLSGRLSDDEDNPQALTAIREVVEIYRGLAEENPAGFAPALAESLNSLSTRLDDTGDKAEALAVTREAIEIYRRLAQESRARFAPALAMGLTVLSAKLGEAGNEPAALTAIHEAIQLHRALVQENPVRFAANIALSLIVLSKLLSRADDEVGAEAAAREAETFNAIARSAAAGRVFGFTIPKA
jgi:tetratricopeptide (TPR) repeat protein